MLPKTAEYALRIVACLAAEPNVSLSADLVARKTLVPRRYLHKVLQDLARAELVASRSGPGGGYSLLVNSQEMSLLQVVNAVAPIERIHSCPLGLRSHTQLCPLHQELDCVYARTEAAFANVTVGSLLDSAENIIPLCDPVGSQ